MDTRTRARLAAGLVGTVVFLLACTCSSTLLNLATLLAGLQDPTLPESFRSGVTALTGGGGLIAGLAVGGVVATLVYRAVLGRNRIPAL